MIALMEKDRKQIENTTRMQKEYRVHGMRSYRDDYSCTAVDMDIKGNPL